MPASPEYKHFIQFCVQWSSIAVLYYDYALTFSREVQYIWRRKFGLTTILYVCCRYALAANVLYLLAISGHIHEGCDSTYMSLSALGVVGRGAVLITWSARTWAVWERSPYILAFLGSITVTVIAIDSYETSGVACTGARFSHAANDALVILVVAFEFISTFLTLWRCIPVIRADRRNGLGSQNSVFLVLAKEGFMYYCFVSLFTMSSAVINYMDHPIRRIPSALTLPFSGMLTARFILHLRSMVGQDIVKTDHGRAIESTAPSQLAFGSNPISTDSSDTRGATTSTSSDTDLEWTSAANEDSRRDNWKTPPVQLSTFSSGAESRTLASAVGEEHPRASTSKRGRGKGPHVFFRD
ncbi:hypothetical protein GGF50DRAFT_107992 [Schizophyllum commune]